MYALGFLALISTLSFATVTVGKIDCPQKFQGKVKEIIDEIGPTGSLAAQRVVFKKLQTLKGDVAEEVQIDILKHGPIEVEPGKDYQVQIRDGRVCWIERI